MRRVRFVGERLDVARILAAADIFCQPNIEAEPFGIVFIEALYAGLPVVASASGGALENRGFQLRDSGSGEKSAEAVAQALRRFAQRSRSCESGWVLPARRVQNILLIPRLRCRCSAARSRRLPREERGSMKLLSVANCNREIEILDNTEKRGDSI